MVKMNCLDFLSIPPNFYIFQEKKNKTNFGGVLFLLYIIIMLFFVLAYILDYAFNPKYEIESSSIFVNVNEISNPPPDPEIDIEIKIKHDDFKNLSKSLFIMDGISENHYGTYNDSRELIFHIKRKASELKYLKLFYRANKTFYEEEFERPVFEHIEFATKELIIDNYGPIPLKTTNNYNYDSEIYIVSSSWYFTCYFNWISIIYKEKQGLSRLFNNLLNFNPIYTSGYVNELNSKNYDYVNQPYLLRTCKDTWPEACLLLGNFIQLESEYLAYGRKKITFIDILAKIGALFSTFNFIFSFINKYYSLNFDNYKIIQKLLEYNDSNKMHISINKDDKTKLFKLNNIDSIEKPLLKQVNEKDDKNNQNNQTVKQNIINDFNSIDGTQEDNIEYNINLPKLSFLDFLFANIYCIFCKKNKKQEIIRECNKIISKITSIDKILFNMIKFEKLIMDYNWNEPELIKMKNDDLFTNLNNLIEN